MLGKILHVPTCGNKASTGVGFFLFTRLHRGPAGRGEETRRVPRLSRLQEIVGVARGLFEQGLPLTRMVDRRLSIDLTLFSRGGMFILDKIERQDFNVLAARPKISKTERVGILLKSLAEVAFQSAA